VKLKKIFEKNSDAELLRGRRVAIFPHLSGNAAKTETLFSAEKNTQKILITPFSRVFEFQNLNFTGFFLPRFTFPPPGQPLFEARKKLFENSFADFVFPRAVADFLKFVNFAAENCTRKKFTFFIGDGRLSDHKNWTKTFRKNLEKIAPLHFLNLEKLPEQICEFG
jgi:hypothetical protein